MSGPLITGFFPDPGIEAVWELGALRRRTDVLKAAVAEVLAERPLAGDESVWLSKQLREKLRAALENCK